jgi:hypothetical protein
METEKMKTALTGIKALADRINEGKSLINILSSKLKPLLAELEAFEVSGCEPLPYRISLRIEAALILTKALKQVIDVNILSGNGLLTRESGVLFHALRKEYE